MPDRHARHRRSATDRRRRPVDGYRMTNATRFDRLVDDAVAGLPDGLLPYLTGIEIAVADVPPERRGPDPDVVLARLRRLPPRRLRRRGADGQRGTDGHRGVEGHRGAEGADATGRLTLYRRPLEARAVSRDDLLDLVQVTIVQELADHFGIDEDRLDEFGWG